MKRILASFYIVSLFATLIITSCNSKKDQYVPIYSAADTLQVNSMISSYLNDLQKGDYDGAVNQLKVLHGPNVVDMSQEQHDELVKYYTQMPVLSYKLRKMTWNDRDLVSFVYDVEFFEKAPGDNIPNTYKINLVPVRIKNIWYLTLGGRN